jgi:hypothetical protein
MRGYRELRYSQIGTLMTKLLEKADERKWDASFANPKSRRAMAKPAAEARAEVAAGQTFDFDPASRPKP